MHDERRRHHLAKYSMRLDVEQLIEQGPTEPEGRRMGYEALRGQFLAGFLVDVIVMPVGLVLDEALLVVEQRIEQHQTMHCIGILRGIERREAAAEARTDEIDRRAACHLAHVLDRCPDVVHHASERQVLLPTLTFSMTSQVEPEARQT